MESSNLLGKQFYHYCPTESFLGIIQNKCIWLNNSNYANDPNENQIAFDILTDIAKDSSNDVLKDHVDNILKKKHLIIDEMSSYVFCVSEEKEDLNQWRLYADQGYGFIIEITPKHFIDNGLWFLLDQNITIPEYDKIYFVKCIYDYNQQRSIVETSLNNFIKQVDAKIESKMLEFKHYLKFISSAFKHPSYKVENEWRAICFPFPGPRDNSINNSIMFRQRRGIILQYIKQDYKFDDQNKPFSSIIMGPNVQNNMSEMLSFLSFNKFYGLRIFKSKLKIRDVRQL